MRVGIATIAAGRSEHLRRQAEAVTATPVVERYVVISMGKPAPVIDGADVISIPADRERLPLSAARNHALRALEDLDLAILLDVDCIPGPDLVDHYCAATITLSGIPALMCGPVGYLDPLPVTVTWPTRAQLLTAEQRVIRRFPAHGVAPEPRAELFWSLSFAVRPAVHRAIGGFDERYQGYGAEDTDYGLRARRAGIGLWMVGGAWAYHQHHAPSPAHQVSAVVRNARRFYARWGRWPMPDRLQEFADAGLIDWHAAADSCELSR